MTGYNIHMRKVPYYTSDDESQWIGHIWRQRDRIGGNWGYCYEIMAPYADEPMATGWRSTQEAAESAMERMLAEKRPEPAVQIADTTDRRTVDEQEFIRSTAWLFEGDNN